MTRKLLEQEGFDVDEALDGAEARTFYFRDHTQFSLRNNTRLISSGHPIPAFSLPTDSDRHTLRPCHHLISISFSIFLALFRLSRWISLSILVLDLCTSSNPFLPLYLPPSPSSSFFVSSLVLAHSPSFTLFPFLIILRRVTGGVYGREWSLFCNPAWRSYAGAI